MNLITSSILSIHHLSLGDYQVPELELSRAEFLHIDASDASFRDLLVDILLLKDTSHKEVEYFKEPVTRLGKDERQRLRRRISYWPVGHEEMIDEKFLKLKKEMIGSSRSEAQQAAKLFLDHLMIGEKLNSKYKRLCYSLLMNAPEILIIDQAMDRLPRQTADELMKVFSRYSDKSGMALIHFTNAEALRSLVPAREFALRDARLLETVID